MLFKTGMEFLKETVPKNWPALFIKSAYVIIIVLSISHEIDMAKMYIFEVEVICLKKAQKLVGIVLYWYVLRC